MKCKNCQTEITQLTNEAGEPTSKRCLKCNPLPVELPASQKKVIENKKVDVPWTDARIRAIVIDEIENYVLKQNSTSSDSAETVVINDEPVNDKGWREQAKELGIDLFQRKKADVLIDIAAKLNVPD